MVRTGTFFHLSADVRELFARHGLDDPAALAGGDVGEVITRGSDGQEVRRLDLGSGGIFFLKRRGRESRGRLAAMCVRCRPWSGPLREKRMADLLQAAGFVVAEPVAWGETRGLFFPRSGFVVTRRVPGSDLALEFGERAGVSKLGLMRETGLLVGRLHAKGFLHPVRLKDLIRRPDGTLVLIDRETGKPWPLRFTVNAGLQMLARSARRTLRDGHRLGTGSAGAFFRGYREGLGTSATVPAAEMRRRFFRILRAELR
jgi:hypothetical protein